jgi:hypothetical protein
MLYPFTKRGKDHLENYRPISLLSLVSKVLERCVFISIKEHSFSQINSSKKWLNFRKIMRDTTNWSFRYYRQPIRSQKADWCDLPGYVKSSRVRLLHRLREFWFGGNLLIWFDSYLKTLRQQTTVLGATSTALPVTCGVPQGSILGPLLYIPMIDTLPSWIRT